MIYFTFIQKKQSGILPVNRALTVNQLLFVASLFRAVLEINYQTRSDITPIWQSLVCSEKYTNILYISFFFSGVTKFAKNG